VTQLWPSSVFVVRIEPDGSSFRVETSVESNNYRRLSGKEAASLLIMESSALSLPDKLVQTRFRRPNSHESADHHGRAMGIRHRFFVRNGL